MRGKSSAFNRTSMESKRRDESGHPNPTNTFNRTSMESKLRCSVRFTGCRLLIEPVWNRNLIRKHLRDNLNASFNRTSMESKPRIADSVSSVLTLLIEPVWNRNLIIHHSMAGILTFNRTSMESKLVFTRVWRFSEVRSAFNRTSMESKLLMFSFDCAANAPFNRTSMESKPARIHHSTGHQS